MIEKMAESSGNVLGYKLTGTITVDDFKKIEPEVTTLVQKEGNVRILFNLTGFKWEKIDALVADLKFGHKFHEKIQKMASSRRQDMGEVDYLSCPSVLCKGGKVLPLSRYGKCLELAQGIIQIFFPINDNRTRIKKNLTKV